MVIDVHKINEDSKIPNRSHTFDSGADVFSDIDYILKPGETYSVPLGISVDIPHGIDATICCKSGLSSKGIWCSNAPIDSGYSGEIHAIIHNLSDSDFKIEKGMKVGQIVFRPVLFVNFVEDFQEDVRGDNGFGSTGIF